MENLEEQLRNEGFCLLRLCADLSNFMQQGQSGKTYLNETKGFLDYITATMQSVDEFVREVVDNPPESELIKIKLKDFGVIKKSLSWLYGWVKEAVYADSLSIPFSLATFLNQTGKKLKKSRNVSLVVLGSPDLMYYKYNLRPLRDVTKNLADRIKDCQPLSKDLGILMFPYCAAREVLANCVLFHEMGHYLYESTELQGEIYEFVKAALSQFIKSEKVMDKLSMPLGAGRSLLNYVSHLMLNWADEIFADIFAISILGPAFHLAYLEMEQILPTKIDRDRNFFHTHPADEFRFKVHAKWLTQGGWDSIMELKAKTVFDRLQQCEALSIADFAINCKPPLESKDALENELHAWMLKAFEELVEHIEKKVSSELAEFPKPIDDFDKYNDLVTTSLEYGVVPSTVYDANEKRCHPKPTTILNAGFFFYLGGMGALLEKIKSKNSDTDKRIMYEKRLNEWLSKAIEDWQILNEEEET